MTFKNFHLLGIDVFEQWASTSQTAASRAPRLIRFFEGFVDDGRATWVASHSGDEACDVSVYFMPHRYVEDTSDAWMLVLVDGFAETLQILEVHTDYTEQSQGGWSAITLRALTAIKALVDRSGYYGS